MAARTTLPLIGLLTLLVQGSQAYPERPVRVVEPFGAGGGFEGRH